MSISNSNTNTMVTGLHIGPSVTSVDDIKSIIRSREPPLTGAMCDLLWADPLHEEVLGYALKDSEYEEVSLIITFMNHYISRIIL